MTKHTTDIYESIEALPNKVHYLKEWRRKSDILCNRFGIRINFVVHILEKWSTILSSEKKRSYKKKNMFAFPLMLFLVSISLGPFRTHGLVRVY